MSFLSFIFLILTSVSMALPTGYRAASFIITCDDKQNPAHLMPLSFFEFQDEINVTKLPANVLSNFMKIAPVMFKNLDKKYQKLVKTPRTFQPAEISRVDPLINPPDGCKVELMAINEYGRREDQYEVSAHLWSQVPAALQNYFLLEAFIQTFLDPYLSPVDFRRFALYVYSGQFETYTLDQKMFFLKHYGINELAYSKISLDFSRPIILYEGTQNVKDAYTVPNATFEEAQIDHETPISFFKSGVVSRIAAMTPFKRIVRGQEFNFFYKNENGSYNERYDKRIQFYPDGTVKKALALPFTNLFNVVTDIKNGILFNKWKYYNISFHEDMTPQSLGIPTGKMKILNRMMNVTSVSWWENGQPHEVRFPDPEVVVYQGKAQEVTGLRFDKHGVIEGPY